MFISSKVTKRLCTTLTRRMSWCMILLSVLLSSLFSSCGGSSSPQSSIPNQSSESTNVPISTPSPTSVPVGTTLLTFTGSGPVGDTAWSPDGRSIASIVWDQDSVQVWDAITGNVIYSYHGHRSYPNSLAWSPDGKRIASSASNVQIWNVVDGGNVVTYNPPENETEVYSVSWSPDEKRIVTVTTVAVRVFDTTTGNEIYNILQDQYASIARWSPDGKYIAVGKFDGTVDVVNAGDGSEVYTYQGDYGQSNGEAPALAWSPDSKRIASGLADKTVQVWDATTGNNVYTYHGHSGGVTAVAWSPDGKRIASGSLDGAIQVWNAVDGGNPYIYRGQPSYAGGVLAWSPDSTRIVSVGGGGGGTTPSQDWVAQVWQAS